MSPRRFTLSIALITLSAFVLLIPVRIVAHINRVSAAAKTQPAPVANDAADDAAIWMHPADPSLSMVIAANKHEGLRAYDLAGREVQHLLEVETNNVNVKQDFPLAGTRVNLVVMSRKDSSLGVYAVDPSRRSLVDVAARPIRPGIESYNVCLHHSVASDRYYVFVTNEQNSLEK
jgi:3-phytase